MKDCCCKRKDWIYSDIFWKRALGVVWLDFVGSLMVWGVFFLLFLFMAMAAAMFK